MYKVEIIAAGGRVLESVEMQKPNGRMVGAAAGAAPYAWNGMPAGSLAGIAQKGVEVLVAFPEKFRALERGGATVEENVSFLLDVRRACLVHKKGTVRIVPE